MAGTEPIPSKINGSVLTSFTSYMILFPFQKLSFLNDLWRSRIILDCRLIAILTKQAG